MDPETTPATTPDPAPTDLAADALTAMDQGIAAAEDTPAADTGAPPAAKAGEDGSDDTSKPDAQTPSGEETSKPPGAEPTPEEKAAAEKAAAEKAAADEAAKAQPDKAVEDEITALGLKEKAAERFRAMSATIAELAPVKEQLEKAGITDMAMLPKFIERTHQAEDLSAMILESGATPDQFTGSLDYMKLVNLAKGGSRHAAEAAFEIVGKEYAELAKALGKEIPGLHDPLAAHKDLLEEVENQTISRERALELAAARDQRRFGDQARTNNEQHQQREQLQAKAVEQGRQNLIAWEQQMATADPTFAARRPALELAVAEIRKNHPPHEWAARAAIALAKIPAPAAAPPPNPPKPPPGPMRPGPSRANLQPETDDPMKALEQGIEIANG